MVSILPPKRNIFNAIADSMSEFGRNAPQLLEERFQRQRGLNALNTAEDAIKSGIVDPATGIRRELDPYEMALQFAKAGAANPGLERSLGPLMQTAMQGGRVNRAFPTTESGAAPGQQTPSQPASSQQGNVPSGAPASMQNNEEPFKGALPVGQPSGFLTPSPFNIPTPQEIIDEGKRYAIAVNDPNAAAMREQQLRNQAATATQQRNDLEDAALKTGDVSPSELPRFMQIGAQFDTRNPNQWIQNTKRAFDQVKNNDKKIERAFIPGIGQALMGQNRDETLKRLIPSSQDQKKLGLEADLRKYYADQYMSPTEIEEQFYPLTPQKEQAIAKFPKGIFSHDESMEFTKGYPTKKTGSTISYEEALEKAPNELKKMQNQLSDFFLKNIDDESSLLVVGNELWNKKNYDWRQIGPAVREAMQRGLKLNQRQSTELTDLETNPPQQSLPDIFRDLSRIPAYLRGNK
jgi:hypothetical protein